jgi:hypothetical protein
LFAKTIEVFLVHLSSFLGGRTHEQIFLLQKAGMSSFGTMLLGKEKFTIFCLTQEQNKIVKENT